ncbi:putative PAS/PAC sensor protein [Desulfosarcina cetonica]|uniref:PAS domain S-box protein n=1 Tax=Desulfosarcina cetonica TaxID=90730 RepID=UPI0006D1E0B7|nr:PAS domain S-box protein [Desulfosarcina cetonica]VTR69454.1 putative PAS/PAC sensor protein [Desulfosarcina cetonica]
MLDGDTSDDRFPSANPIPCRQILSLLGEGVAVLTRGRVIYANTALCEMTGLNRGEILGCTFLSLVADPHRALISDCLRQVDVACAAPMTFRLQRGTSAGRQVRMAVAELQLHGSYSDDPGILCSLTDITDFQDRIIELERANRRMRSHLDDTESVLISFAPYDCNDILLINRHVEALLGCSIKEIMNGRRHLFDFVHPDHLSRVMDFYNGFPDTHETEEIEYPIINNSRQTRWVRDMGNTLFVEHGGGMPRRIDHTLVDITDQKNREMELREERRKLASILKNSTDMIYRVDKAGNFLELNPAGLKLLGFGDDFKGRNILDAYVDQSQRERLLLQLEEKGQAQQLTRWKVADEMVIDVVINAVQDSQPQGNGLSYQGIVHNVTHTLELKKLETIKKMAGGLSDKINTPLMTLLMNIQLMRETVESATPDTAEILECLDEMEKAYHKIVGPMQTVRENYWYIDEVPDGCGGTIYEVRDKR